MRLASLLVFWLAATACEPAPTSLERDDRRPNILLVTVETLRADHLGSLGYTRNTTPNLDRIAAQGVQFENAVAQAPFTLPSISSLMTGQYPATHGVRNHPGRLADDVETLAERLQQAGYQTAAMTRHSWLRRKSGLDQGFDEYHNNKFSSGLDARSLSLSALDWIGRRDTSRPFFLWIHFLDPHLPYTPSYPYSLIFDSRPGRGAAEDDRVSHLRSMVDTQRDNFEPTPYADLSGGPYYDLVLRHFSENRILLDLALWRRSRGAIFFEKHYRQDEIDSMLDLYDGAILYTDDNIGRLMRGLREAGIDEQTVVAIAGDHGEAFGEHELYFTHDFTLYDEVLRVPLILRWPEKLPVRRIAQQVRLMDLAPTLLDLVGLPGLQAADATSLKPLLEEGGSLPFLNAFSESAPFRHMFPEHTRVYLEGNRGKWRALRTERWKLINIPHPEGDRFELYDLVNDPLELTNLYEELPGEAARLMPDLKEWIDSDRARQGTATDQDLGELDPAQEQQLRTLGYIR